METIIIGKIPLTCKKTEHYFSERGMFVDCRGELTIAESAMFGFGVKLLTASHTITSGTYGGQVNKSIIIGNKVWVASFCIIYNSVLEDNCIVSAGTVLNSVIVPSYTIVAGNPGMIVSKWHNGKWNETEGIKLQRRK
jgi:acetyltransferase-like isoleucine patch superfamily enzyme